MADLVGRAGVTGIDGVSDVLLHLFPKEKEARSLYNRTLSAAAKASIIPIAKRNADQMDASGALSEAIKPRARSRAKALADGAVASVEVTPVMGDMKAIMKYIAYYYPDGNLPVDKNGGTILTRGIRHGHLQEWGTVHHGPQSFLVPAITQGFRKFGSVFSDLIKVKIMARVRQQVRRAKKAGFK